MTSKEALTHITEELKTQWYDDCYCLEDDDKEAVETIKKDLEILEILKSSIMLIENKQITLGYGKYHLAIRPNVILSDDTIKIIKEWLNNAN